MSSPGISIKEISSPNVVVANEIDLVSIAPVALLPQNDAMVEAYAGLIGRITDGSASQTDHEQFKRAVVAGEEGTLAFPGAIIVTNSASRIEFATHKIEGPDPALIVAAIEAAKQAIANDERLQSLQVYQRALRRFTSILPYHLPGKQAPKLEQVFVSLSAHKNSEEKEALTEASLPSGVASLMVTQEVEASKAIILSGIPGSGKSTVLRFIARNAWDQPAVIGLNGPRLAIYCRLRSIVHAKGSTASLRIREAITSMSDFVLGGRGITEDFLECWPEMTGAKLLFLFDAFDEVAEEHRVALVRWLSSMREEYPDAGFVISTRDHGLFEGTRLDPKYSLTASTYLTLNPLTKAEARLLASHWMHENPMDLVERGEIAGLQDTFSTPLGISMAAVVYENDKILPEFRSALYERYINIALEEAIHQGFKDQTHLDIPRARHLLQTIAWRSTELGELTEQIVCECVADGLRELTPDLTPTAARAESETVSRVLTERSGILTGYSEWKHETFREFLAARRLNKHLRPDSQALDSQALIDLMRRHKDSQWRGVFLFLFSFWSPNATKGSEASLEVYRPVLEVLIGAAPPLRKRLWGSWLGRLFSFGKPSSPIESLTTEAVSPNDATFAAEIIAELGAAPQSLEERTLELIMLQQSSIEASVMNFCSSLFSDEGHKEKRILNLWHWRSRLDQRLEPWVKSWIQDIQSGSDSDDLFRRIGMLLFLGREAKVEEILVKPPAHGGIVLLAALKAAQVFDKPAIAIKSFRQLQVELEKAELAKSNADSALKIEEFNEAYMQHVDANSQAKEAKKFFEEAIEIFAKENPKQSAKAFAEKLTARSGVALGALKANQMLDKREIAMEALSQIKAKLEKAELAKSNADSALKVEERMRTFKQYLYADSQAEETKKFFEEAIEIFAKENPKLLLAELERPTPAEETAKAIAEKLAAKGHSIELINTCPRIQNTQVLRVILSVLGEATEKTQDIPTELQDQILTLCNKCLGENAKDTWLLRARAKLLEKFGKNEEAEGNWSTIVKITPEDGDAYEERARLRFNLDRLDEALTDIDRSLTQEGDLWYRWYLKGRILQGMNRHREAISCFNEAENAGNTQYRLYLRRADSRFYLGLLDDALKDAQAVLDSDTDHAEARMMKAACLSSLGRWKESEQTLHGIEDTMSNRDNWAMTRLQNLICLGQKEAVKELIAHYEQAEGLGIWEEILALFFESQNEGMIQQNRLKRLSELIAKEPPEARPNQFEFWKLCAVGDKAKCRGVLDRLSKIMKERDLRWIAINGRATLASFLPAWTEPLIAKAAAAEAVVSADLEVMLNIKPAAKVKVPPIAGSNSPSSLAAGSSHARQGSQGDTPSHLPTGRTKKIKYLAIQGLFCELAGIQSYDDEKVIAEALLEKYRSVRTIIIIPILDSGHIYIHANMKWSKDANYNFKGVGEYIKFRDYGKLNEIIEQKNVQKIVVTDKSLYIRMRAEPHFRSYRDLFILEQRSLPYTSSDVEFQ